MVQELEIPISQNQRKHLKPLSLKALEILKTRKTQEVSGSSRNISNKIKTLRGRI